MTLNLPQQNAQRHALDHLTFGPPRDDQTCLLCYPVIGLAPRNVYNCTEWIHRDIQPIQHYNQNTVVTLQIAELKRVSITVHRHLNRDNRDILIAYKRVIQTIRFRRVPIYSAGDLGYFIAIGSLTTTGFGQIPNEQITRRLLHGTSPVPHDYFLYEVIEELKRVWTSASTTRRYLRGRSPEPRTPEETTPRTRPRNSRVRSNSPHNLRPQRRTLSQDRIPVDRTPITIPPPPIPRLAPLIPIPPPPPPPLPRQPPAWRLSTQQEARRAYRRRQRLRQIRLAIIAITVLLHAQQIQEEQSRRNRAARLIQQRFRYRQQITQIRSVLIIVIAINRNGRRNGTQLGKYLQYNRTRS